VQTEATRWHHMCALAPSAHGWNRATTSATVIPGAACRVAYLARRHQACMATMTWTTTTATAASSTSGRPSSPRCHPSWTVSMGLPPSPPSSGPPATAVVNSSRHEPRRGWLLRQQALTWLVVCRQIILGCSALGLHSSSPTSPVPETLECWVSESCDAGAPHVHVI
jgi:hypothetical protein